MPPIVGIGTASRKLYKTPITSSAPGAISIPAAIRTANNPPTLAHHLASVTPPASAWLIPG
jgi:hypothetical protein